LILICADPDQVRKLRENPGHADITLKELVPIAFIAESGPTGALEVPLKQSLAGIPYILSPDTSAQATREAWTNLLAPYAESRAGEPSEHDLYVMIHEGGGGTHIADLETHLAAMGVAAKKLTHRVYIIRPTASQAATFPAKLRTVIDDLDGDSAVVRLRNWQPSIPLQDYR
jgi:hypothetical protein